MNIDLHILTWNESDIIRLVLRHYKTFCRAMYVYDNHSTDNTRDIAQEEGAIVKTFGTQFFDDQENMNLKNNCWKGSDADWVIVCDCDEVLHDGSLNTEQIKDVIEDQHRSGITIFKTEGWQVMSDKMPPDDCILCETNGYFFGNYSKRILFNPSAITSINYGLGAHECNPSGIVEWSMFSLYVLHYKHIGGLQRTIDRYNQYKPRMSKFNRKHGHGRHYNRTVSSLRQEWAERMAKSRPLI